MGFWKHFFAKFMRRHDKAPSSSANECSICGRPLDVSLDPMSGDCGGDCWGCIGMIEADMGGSVEDNLSIGFVAKEISWGWREMDGRPKAQDFFLESNPSFIQVKWHHHLPDEPVEIWSELNGHREEVRKLEVWADGRTGYAVSDTEVGGSRLSETPIPPLDTIAADPQFEVKEVSRFAFETRWDAK